MVRIRKFLIKISENLFKKFKALIDILEFKFKNK